MTTRWYHICETQPGRGTRRIASFRHCWDARSVVNYYGMLYDEYTCITTPPPPCHFPPTGQESQKTNAIYTNGHGRDQNNVGAGIIDHEDSPYGMMVERHVVAPSPDQGSDVQLR